MPTWAEACTQSAQSSGESSILPSCCNVPACTLQYAGMWTVLFLLVRWCRRA